MNKLITTLAIAALAVATGTAKEGRLLRFPATNGTNVVFSYAGDLYRVPISGGTAQRLTSHNGYEMFARFSPDGNTIAFTAQYDGNTEVYLMPQQGGEPQRITFTATNSRDDMGDRMGPNNVAMAWTPDGRNVVFRNRISDGFSGKLWLAPVNGGMPTELPLPEGGFCCYSPDGKQLAYNRVFREFRTWKHYKGGMADDIWVYDTNTRAVTNITNNVAQDIFPMWIGDEIYFASDRDFRMNLFVYNTTTKQTSKVTNFTDFDVKFPSCGGGMIVFENGGYIYTLNPKTKEYKKINIELNSEGSFARAQSRNVEQYITSVDLSPNNQRLAVTARGDIFNVPVERGVTQNLTRSAGSHEREASWGPNGDYMAFISDQTGETELWLRDAQTGATKQLTHDNDTYIRDYAWSNNGKKIVYTDRRNRMVMVDIDTQAKQVIAQDSISEMPIPAFSPDDRWLAYTRMQSNDFSVIYLYSIETGKEYAVTERWYDSSAPSFSNDGRYLFFASARDFNPIYSSVEWNFAYREMEGIYMIPLAKNTPSPFLIDESNNKPNAPQDEALKADKKGDKKDKKAAKPSTEVATTTVDIDGITQRIIRVPNIGTGSYHNLVSDGKTLYYSSRGATYAYNLQEQKSEQIISGARLYPSHDLKKALVSIGGSFYVIDMPRGKANLGDPVDMSQLICNINYTEEWQQIFNEAWRAFRDGFYLENMHGVDWQAIRDRYAQLLPYVQNRLDLTYVIGGMIGELACGHAYVDGGDHITPQRSYIGLLGAKLSQEGNYFRIDHIYQGAPDRQALRSPLLEPGLNIKEGDYITAVNGISTSTTQNIYSLLTGKANCLTELTINTTAAEGGRKVVVKPIADEYPLVHYEWIQRNIEHVNKLSGGRIGYIYIPDMGPDGLNEFARYYYPQVDKEALIIDDRANGGGNISPMVIERLLRQPYRMTMYRGSKHNGLIPDKTQYGPKALLLNKYSASDGDLFPWSFKKNKIGTVIGTRSWGGIIGISGSLPYIDGTDIRVPFFTNYDTNGQWIVENHGVDPDILIDNDPTREFDGEDQQLDKAIEVLLQQLNERQPLPTTPAPRTLNDLGVKEQ
ncbi:MAG: S41 family peptidase [Muribaculaceae bacterium]